MDLNTTSKTFWLDRASPRTQGSAGRIGRPTQQRRHHTTIRVNGNNHRPYGGEFALDAPSTKVFEPLLNSQARVRRRGTCLPCPRRNASTHRLLTLGYQPAWGR